MKQEFGELEELAFPGMVDSSTMPQKRNPILAQDTMLKLGEALGREEAHDVVYDIAQTVATKGGTFVERLSAHPEVGDKLSQEKI